MQRITLFALGILFTVTPLIFSLGSSELFEFPKILVIYAISALLVSFFALYKLTALLSRIKKHTISLLQYPSTVKIVFIAVIIFLISQIIATFTSIDSHTSVFGYYSRFNGGLLSTMAYIGLFFATYLTLAKPQVKTVLKVIVGGAAAVSLWGLPSKFGYDFICLLSQKTFDTSCWTQDFDPTTRLFSTLGQPNWLAAYLLIPTLIVLYLLYTKQKLIRSFTSVFNNTILIAFFILFSTEIIWTQSRSGILSYALMMLFFLIGTMLSSPRKKKQKSRYNKHFLIAGVIALFFIIYSATPILSQYFKRTTPSSKTPSSRSTTTKPQKEYHVTPSSDIRLIVWQGAWNLALRYPLFGTGVETFAYSYYFTRPIAHNLTSEWNFVYNKAHNELLNYLATTGFIGFFSYLFMLGSFVVIGLRAFKKNKEFALLFLASIGGITITNFFGFSTTTVNLFFYILPALLLIEAGYKKEDAELSTTVFKKQFLISYGFIVVIILLYLANYFYADFYFARAKEQKSIDNVVQAYQLNEKALTLRQDPVYMDQQALLMANIAASLKLQGEDKEALKFENRARELNERTLQNAPNNVFYWKTSAKVNYLFSIEYLDNTQKNEYFFTQSLKAIKKAQELAPTDPKILYTHALLIVDTQPKQAQLLLKEAVRLKPNYTDAKNILEELENSGI